MDFWTFYFECINMYAQWEMLRTKKFNLMQFFEGTRFSVLTTNNQLPTRQTEDQLWAKSAETAPWFSGIEVVMASTCRWEKIWTGPYRRVSVGIRFALTGRVFGE